jgi:pyrroloquinoline quinone biosynthesis protein D
MPKPIDLNTTIRIASPYRLQWEDAQGAFVLLYPEGMVSLNSSAGEILQVCDGSSTVSEIISKLKEKFQGADIESDILACLETAHAKGWISNE